MCVSLLSETPDAEVAEYLNAGIKACKEVAKESGISDDGLLNETRKCTLEWLKGEEYKQEHALIIKAKKKFREEFEQLFKENEK
jgi:hypothetical protein